MLKLFDDEASPDLYFHNSAMVRNICMQVDLISTAERLPDEEYVMLKLAAMLLFTGYITNYDSPLDESLRYAGEILPRLKKTGIS